MFHTLEMGTVTCFQFSGLQGCYMEYASSCRLLRMLYNNMLLMSKLPMQKQNKKGKHIILYQIVRRSNMILLGLVTP